MYNQQVLAYFWVFWSVIINIINTNSAIQSGVRLKALGVVYIRYTIVFSLCSNTEY